MPQSGMLMVGMPESIHISGQKIIPQADIIRNIYVHVPFCTHICPYCSFYKTRNLTHSMAPFLPALEREVEAIREYLPVLPETIFFGGGTPTALSVSQLTEMGRFWPWKEVMEFTMEANPMTVSSRKAETLQELGVNRISLGVQAFDETSLQLLGRTHRAPDVVKTFRRLRQYGFNNINIDLMFALPGQSMQTWQSSLQQALELEPDHISLYELTYEEDTEFLEKLQAGLLQEESTGQEMHEWAIELLHSNEFVNYEVSNFARTGKEARHNLACWAGEDYIGLGPSACSTVGRHRWKTVADIHRYGNNPLEREWEIMDESTRRQEKIMLGLRTNRGIPGEWIQDREQLVENLEQDRFLRRDQDRIVLTSRGLLVADSITEELL
ncbi:MAG: radical SAM family heme chaperone HemW [Verrucomicrobiota bacterium]